MAQMQSTEVVENVKHSAGLEGGRCRDAPARTELRVILSSASNKLFNDNRSSRPVQSYLDAVGDIGVLTQEQEQELARRAGAGDDQARNAMIVSNLRLVAAIAKRYRNRGLPMQDLLQEGNIGLMKAVGKFDPSRGNRFSTYASWWIREAITRALSNKSRTIRLPVHLTEMITKLRRVRSSLSLRLGRTPTSAEIGQELNVSSEKLEYALQSSQACLSLDQPVNGDESDGCEIADVVVDPSSLDPEERANRAFVRIQIGRMLSKLTERERRVVDLRFGLESGKSRRLREVAAMMGLTRDQVGKLSCRAMRKLRRIARDEHLDSELASFN